MEIQKEIVGFPPSFLLTVFKGMGHDVSLTVDADPTSAKAIAPSKP